jgi:DNA-binding MurR/RpiR family transcriptional regulator
VSEQDYETTVDPLADAREVLRFGIGPSESIARYLALRLRRLGHAARRGAPAGPASGSPTTLLPLSKGDVVVRYVPGRLLPDINVLIDHAKEVEAHVVLVTDSLGSLLGKRVDVVLPADSRDYVSRSDRRGEP